MYIAARHIQEGMLNINVRLNAIAMLPSLYLELLNQTQFLIDDGLSSTEIDDLKKLYPKIEERCRQLAQYRI